MHTRSWGSINSLHRLRDRRGARTGAAAWSRRMRQGARFFDATKECDEVRNVLQGDGETQSGEKQHASLQDLLAGSGQSHNGSGLPDRRSRRQCAGGNLRASRNGRSRGGVAQSSPRRAGHPGLPANPTPLIRADPRRGRG